MKTFDSVTDLTSLEFPVQIIECKSREEWLSARRKRLQASDTAAILGHGYANQSPATIWESKVTDNDLDPITQPKYLRIGKLMEPSLSLIFSEETDMPVIPVGDFTIYCHPLIEWLGCTLDGKTIHDEFGLCPLELKNIRYSRREEWENDKAPLKFAIQIQHQLAVTGATHGFLLGFIGGNEPIVRIIERDEPFIDAMLETVAEFWGYVLGRELPPVDGTEATAGVLKRLFGKDDGNTTMLPRDAAEWAIERETASAIIKEMKSIQQLAENNLKSKIGGFSFGDLPHKADYRGASDRVAELMKKTVERIGVRQAPLSYSWKQQATASGETRVLRACK
ncbi:YqaJ viral recombinase family protein [Anatilimnocola sp. NA78]|uniref:YqaJ viral recombinase family nuclease n=1 Tax=Anatilimnocola sp. NA78 TaxID=3415683 RepID=UPI003CE45AA4